MKLIRVLFLHNLFLFNCANIFAQITLPKNTLTLGIGSFTHKSKVLNKYIEIQQKVNSAVNFDLKYSRLLKRKTYGNIGLGFHKYTRQYLAQSLWYSDSTLIPEISQIDNNITLPKNTNIYLSLGISRAFKLKRLFILPSFDLNITYDISEYYDRQIDYYKLSGPQYLKVRTTNGYLYGSSFTSKIITMLPKYRVSITAGKSLNSRFLLSSTLGYEALPQFTDGWGYTTVANNPNLAIGEQILQSRNYYSMVTYNINLGYKF
jgi:hypothetical protein